MKLFKQALLLFLFLLLFWMLFTPKDFQELSIGIIVALILTLLFASRASLLGELRLTPKAFFFGLAYIFVFLLELLKSNLDVASRVLNPALPIKPGIVKVRTKLKTRLGRIVLANSITLTPGTLTVETRGENFYIHWIDVSAFDVETASQAITEHFERYLEVIFG
jgi:multicomponent Na+:H+ antiporter subunit E